MIYAESIITQTSEYVQQQLTHAEAGHDWFHINRVWKLAKKIANTEPAADIMIVELAALLHDIADPKFHHGDEEIGPQMANDFLRKRNVLSEDRIHITNIIRHMSFKNSFDDHPFSSLEMHIVQDADRLDALGAIGIARTFHFGGFKNHRIYDPDVPPRQNLDKASYTSGVNTSINHFYEKLLRLPDMMNTAYARRLAIQRAAYMEEFLQTFKDEWEME